MTKPQDKLRGWAAARKALLSGLRFTSLRLRLVVVFGLVALTAAVSASGIAYWLNREAVLTRTQDAVLRDFQQEMRNHASMLPVHPAQDELQRTAGQMANSSQRFSVLLTAEDANGRTITGNSELDTFTLEDVPESLRKAVNKQQPLSSNNKSAYHLYWQRITDHDKPYLVGGARVIDGSTTGYMLKSLEPEAKDLNSLAWSLGIATGLALIGSALLAQAAATTVLKPVHRLGIAAHAARRGQAGHPAAGLRDGRTRRSVTDVQPDGGGPGETGRGHERAGRGVAALRRRHVPRTPDAADRDHRRHRDPRRGAGRGDRKRRPDDRSRPYGWSSVRPGAWAISSRT